MYLVDDLLDLCKEDCNNKKIYLIVENNGEKYKIPMTMQYYVADDIFFFEVGFENKDIANSDEFIELLEDECKNDMDCWGYDLYISPMEKVGNCELRFAKNMLEVYNDYFDNCYEIKKIESKIVNIENGQKEILIYLK